MRSSSHTVYSTIGKKQAYLNLAFKFNSFKLPNTKVTTDQKEILCVKEQAADTSEKCLS